ncbi:adenosylcobinamide-GDP ribazoletransferase [Persicirhabdus sediminis]|uniref:Adenosylcobinamide-GDP ribazoletransferase n=1 Tax=Persicirhabdus sediminis TaxID=454144 RepID=A0A8J7SLB1_9BACT|nr:adenosylcobinamide-GDP ribazoletransferase [Persicirhabdus sediminis]MBK1791290.1 adenosylcobinamide-GDP ribazoletransferase [Persicirhabdus sediminis]
MIFFRSIRASVLFLTRIPLGGYPYSDEENKWSTAHFPLVGAMLGVLAALVYCLAFSVLGPWPASFLMLGVMCLLTGGFHEDGLADTADAIGGAYNREKLFEILKDSRLGSFGTLALVVVIGFKMSCLATLPDKVLASAAVGDHSLALTMLGLLVFTQSLSRLFPVILLVCMPYATTDAAAKSRQVSRADWRQGVTAIIWAALVLAVLVFTQLISVELVGVSLLAGSVLAVLLARYFHYRAGGVTGDFLGASQQLIEVTLFICIFACL